MDWGLGNPNKTAALIALLMLAVWTLPLLRRWLFWVALPAFAALGVCLMHTMSRGGVVAAAAGSAVLLVHLRRVRPWPRGRMLAVAGAVVVMLAGNGVYQTSARFARSCQDRSISNRLAVWGQAPRMMADAPWGWGAGNSGRAYMSWYQPLENTEPYRTLVNSHLTWLVEWGWPLRLLYALGWAAAFVLCCGHPRCSATDEDLFDHRTHGKTQKTDALPFLFCGVVGGVWTAFFVAAAFSSVAEAPALWIVPVLGLAGVLAVRGKLHLWPSRLVWAGGAAAAVLSLGALAVWGYAAEHPAGAGRLAVLRNGAVCVGVRPPRTWVVVGKGNATLSDTYPRNYRGQQTHPPVGLAPSLAALPPDLTGCRLAVIGALEDWSALSARAKTCEALLLIAPDAFPDEVSLPEGIPTRVVFGEFSNRPSAAAWQGTGLAQTLEGVGDFFQDWPELVFGALK
jgi:hypothetical protein